MMRGAWVVGEAGWAAGLAAAAAEALLGAGCWFNSLARSAAPGRSCAQAGLETGADASARQSPAEVARNNLLLRRNVRIPVSANSSMGAAGAARFSEKIQPDQVIPGCQEHQPQHQNQPKPKSNVLGPRTKRTPQNSFASIVQKMPPVEERNRKKIGQPDAYRKDSYQVEQRQKAEIRHLARHIGDSHRTAELVGADMAPDHLANPQNGVLDDAPGFGTSRDKSPDRAVALVRHRGMGVGTAADHHP